MAAAHTSQRRDRSGPNNTRICTRCNLYLPIEQFGVDNKRYDKLCTWCKTCKNAAADAHHKAHPEQMRERHRKYMRANAERINAQQRVRNRQRRVEVLAYYGGKCDCCGEWRFEFLSIDHINGGGTQHRKELGGGDRMMRWLIRNGYPTEYRVLCHNCNQAFGYYGTCPHQTEQTEGVVDGECARG